MKAIDYEKIHWGHTAARWAQKFFGTQRFAFSKVDHLQSRESLRHIYVRKTNSNKRSFQLAYSYCEDGFTLSKLFTDAIVRKLPPHELVFLDDEGLALDRADLLRQRKHRTKMEVQNASS